MRNKLAVLLAISFVGLGWSGGAFGQANQPAPPSVIELPYPYELGSTYEVTKVDPGGTAQIVEVGPSPESEWAEAGRLPDRGRLLPAPNAKRPEPSLPAGDYLMLVRPLIDGGEPRLFRVEVRVAGAKEWTVQLGKAGAAKLQTGDRCSMIRPQNLTAAQLRALPEVIPFTPRKDESMSQTAPMQARTLANLNRIGVALRQFEDAHDFWPPAFLVGPDGKPWHSWRVLLLPYLGHRDLFDQYDFSQPWDSAKNLRLLDKMPAVFHDPIYGDELGHFTHYAALVGSNRVLTAFSASDVKMKNVTILPLERLSEQYSRMGMPRILKIDREYAPYFRARGPNGTSATIVVAAVSPERKIPWTKPEDITVGPKFPLQLGKPDGIAAPYSFGERPTIHRAAPVLFAFGLSIALLDTIEPSSLYALLTPESSNFIEWKMIPEARFAIFSSPLSTKLLVDCASGRATITEPTLIEAGPPPRPIRRTPLLEPEPGKGRPRTPVVIELPYPYEPGWTYKVTKVDPGGTAQIVAVGPSRALWRYNAVVPEPGVFGGPCLMLVKPLVDGGEPRLFRVEVNVVGVMECTVELGKAGAAKIRPGDRCYLVGLATAEHLIVWLGGRMQRFERPPTWTLDHLRSLLIQSFRTETGSYPTTIVTEDQLRALPQVIPVTASRTEKPKARESLPQARTLANLSEIGRAMHAFNLHHRFMPPALLVGPDGKPWHSWRVLLLPYLGNRDLFDQYDFSEPWDSAKNLRLLDKMPSVYHDPIYGEKLGHFTHYAALVGDGPGPKLNDSRPGFQAAFSPSGLSMNDATILPLGRLPQWDFSTGPNGESSVSMPHFLEFSDWQPPNGSISISHVSTTIVVAAVTPERKIPWTKPEDITVGPESPLQLGKPGGIAAPYSSGKAPHLHRAAPVLFGDGKSSAIVDTIDPAIFRAILNRTPGVQVDRLSQVPVARFAEYRSPPFTKLLIDCDNHRAMITGPELIEPGEYHGATQIELPYPYELGWTYEITKVDPGGAAQIVKVGPKSALKPRKNDAPVGNAADALADEAEAMLIEGLHLMLIQPLAGSAEPRLLRVEVSAVGTKESTVQLGKAGAAKVRTGDRCYLIRQNVTAAQLRALPEIIPFTAEKEESKSPTARSLARSLSNLSHIGITLHKFANGYNSLPPAVLVGPDGKPWHSWRVLLLPYLGYRDLFDQYDLSQPWDSAKNLRLLDRMPAVYHDPIYGDHIGPFTHYAALVGDGPGPKLAGRSYPPAQTAFPASGWKLKNVTISPLERLFQRDVRKDTNGDIRVSTRLSLEIEGWDDPRIGLERFTDGTSNTIVIAAVSPDRKIPWTKPEDITVGTEFPLKLGEAGGIAAPHSFGKGPTAYRAAPVLFADGSGRALPDTTDPSTLYGLLTLSGGEVIGLDRIVDAPGCGYFWSRSPKLVIDCESGSATITEPSQAIRPDLDIRTLDQLGQPAPTSAIALPYPYELGWNPALGRWTYKVTKVDPGGTVQIVEVGPGPEIHSGWLIEGLYLMVVLPLVDGGELRLLRVDVTDVRTKEWTVRLGKAGAARVRTGDCCYMIRPHDMNAAQLRALPEVIPLTAEKEKAESRTALLNLSNIGLALQQFEDAHNFWPPAVLVGPDGKPWHSWRVLLLPYLGHRDLFDQYDFSQPWDSAKNLRLLDKMPSVYHDPIYGEKPGNFTHYAALLGGGPGPKRFGREWPVDTAFSASGVKMKDVTILPLERLSERDVSKGPNGELRIRTPRILKIERSDSRLIRMADFRDGTSNTIAVAAVSPERKIPWTKPEDITVGPEFPLEPGKPGGIAAPYSSGTRPTIRGAAPVLFADGTSSLLLDTIDPSTLYALLTRDAGDVPDASKVAEARLAVYTRSRPATLQIDCESGRATITEPNLSALRPDLEKSVPHDRPPRKP